MKASIIKFSITARVLHWLSALVILWATVSGLFMAFFELDAEIKKQILDFNLSITLVFMPFFLWRTVHRIQRGVPPYANSLSTGQTQLASSMHTLLYAIVWIVLLSGVLMLDQDFSVFTVGDFAHLINDESALVLFRQIHHFASYLLTACIVLHVFAVVKHEYKGVRILNRIV